MCGYNLQKGVLFISVASTVLYTTMSLISVGCLISVSDKQFNNHPVIAVNFFFGLVASWLSIYVLVISLLLLWQALKGKGNIFLCSLWYVSHISHLTLFFLLFSAKVVVCFIKDHNFTAVFTAVIGIIYEGIFIYFAVVVNSYLHSLHQERYL